MSDEKAIFNSAIDKGSSSGKLQTARRQAYDVRLSQIKQCLDAGQVELAQELFRELELDQRSNETRGFEWWFLDGLLKRTSQMLDGQAARISCLSVSPQGETVVSGDFKGRVIAWDLVRKTSRVLDEGHGRQVQRVAVNCDLQRRPRMFASLCQLPDRSLELKLWSPETVEPVACLQSSPFQGNFLADFTTFQFAPDGDLLILCGIDADDSPTELLAWKRDRGRWRADPERSALHVTRQAFSPDGTLLAEGTSDGSIRLLGLKRPQPAVPQQKTGGRRALPGVFAQWQAPGRQPQRPQPDRLGRGDRADRLAFRRAGWAGQVSCLLP